MAGRAWWRRRARARVVVLGTSTSSACVVTELRADGRFDVRSADGTSRRFAGWVRYRPDIAMICLTAAPGDGPEAPTVAEVLNRWPSTMIVALTDDHKPVDAGPLRGVFAVHSTTELSHLGDRLTVDLELFRRALGGDEVIAPAAMPSDPQPGPGALPGPDKRSKSVVRSVAPRSTPDPTGRSEARLQPA